LRLGFRDAYDTLGTGVLASLAYALLAGAGLFGGQALGAEAFRSLPGVLPWIGGGTAALLGWALVGGPAAAGVFQFARKTAAREEPEVFDLAWGFRAAFGRSVGLAAVQALGLALAAGNSVFYFAQGSLAPALLGAGFAYAAALWAVACLYQWPLLVQEPEASVLKVVRKSALLVLANPGYTAGLALVCLLLTALLCLTIAGAFLLWAALLAALTTQATRELLRKYGVLGPDPTLDPITDEAEW